MKAVVTGMRAVFGSARSRIATGLLAIWLACVAFAVMSPTSQHPSAVVAEWVEVLRHFDAPTWLSQFKVWEAAFNVLLFVPAGLLGPVVTRMRGGFRWFAAGLLTGLVVELVQEFALPHRDASIQDVGTNGAGVLLGYLLFAVASQSSNRTWQHRLRATRPRRR